MAVFRKMLDIQSSGEGDMIDITDRVRQAVSESGMERGLVCVFLSGSTGALITIEYEGGLVQDMRSALNRLFPDDIVYEHHLRWGDGNGHSHIRASFLGASVTVPFANGRLDLGTWQQIAFLELDVRPRRRQLILQAVGE